MSTPTVSIREARIDDEGELLKLAIRLTRTGMKPEWLNLHLAVSRLRPQAVHHFRKEVAMAVIDSQLDINVFAMLFENIDVKCLQAVITLCNHLGFVLGEYKVYDLILLWETAYRKKSELTTDDLHQAMNTLRRFVLAAGSPDQIKRVKKSLDQETWLPIKRELVDHFMNLPTPTSSERKAQETELIAERETSWQMIRDAKSVLDEIKEMRLLIPERQAETTESIEQLEDAITNEEEALQASRQVRRTREIEMHERKLTSLRKELGEWIEWRDYPVKRVRALRSQLMTGFAPEIERCVHIHNLVLKTRRRVS